MRRTARQLAIHLVLGAILTICAAWIAALWLPIAAARDARSPPYGRMLGLLDGEHMVHRRAGLGRTHWQVMTPRTGWKQEATLGQYGFPFRALEWQRLRDLDTGAILPHGRFHDGVTFDSVWKPYIPYRSGFHTTLPLRPLWSRFAADTGVWALATWTLGGIARLLRRRWPRRARCPACSVKFPRCSTCPACGSSAQHAAGLPGRIARAAVRSLVVIPAALVATVAVAWTCALWSPLRSTVDLPTPSPGELIGDTWALDAWRAPLGLTMDEHLLHAGVGIRVETLDCTRMTCFVGGWTISAGSGASPAPVRPVATVPTAPPAPRSTTRVRAGWPFHALECRPDRIVPPGLIRLPAIARTPATTNVWQEGLALPFRTVPLKADIPRRLPIKPVWHGLILNLAFYAALLLAAHMAARRFRGVLRRRRGLCPRCAYERADLPICPECGHS